MITAKELYDVIVRLPDINIYPHEYVEMTIPFDGRINVGSKEIDYLTTSVFRVVVFQKFQGEWVLTYLRYNGKKIDCV